MQREIFVASLLLFVLSSMQRFLYEIFLRFHQALAITTALALWRYFSLSNAFDRIYILVADDSLIVVMLLETINLVFCNLTLKQIEVQANAIQISVANVDDIVKINLIVPRIWKVRVEQYINVCISQVSSWSFLQSHFFVIISWTEEQNSFICCLIQSNSDFTRRLLIYAHKSCVENAKKENYVRAWFTESHERIIDISTYDSVMLIATDFDIVAQLSYVKKLIQDYNNDQICIWWMHLLWQIKEWD